ncbi:hypothetical protein BZA77DRAFT_384731 [Pyronema omphalodes]|nr:hypothetical protein BZA77DRAFT_384731 [Pyronema omphalodes]
MTEFLDIFSNPWSDSVSPGDNLSGGRSTEDSSTIPRTVPVAENEDDRDSTSTALIASEPEQSEHEDTEGLPGTETEAGTETETETDPDATETESEVETVTEGSGFIKKKKTAEQLRKQAASKHGGSHQEEGESSGNKTIAQEEAELARQLQNELLLEEVSAEKVLDTPVLTPPGTPPRNGPIEPDEDEAEEEKALLEFELCKLRIDAYVLEDELKEVRREKQILETQNQNLTERVLREVTESQRLRQELESTKEQLRKALYLGVRARAPPPKPSKPQFGFPGPLRTRLPPVDPPPFKEYVGMQQVGFGQLAQQVSEPIPSFSEALKAAHESMVSAKKPEPFGKPVNTNTATVPAKSIFEVQRNLPSATFYYEPYQEAKGSTPISTVDQIYQHISAVAPYRNMSPEELRLVDYQRGYRFPVPGTPVPLLVSVPPAFPPPLLPPPKEMFLKKQGPEPEQFKPVIWNEGGVFIQLHNIAFMPGYVQKSPEELRLEHYELGWRYKF